MKKRYRKGATEFVYFIIVLVVCCFIIGSFNIYYRNVIKLNKETSLLNDNYLETNNINTTIIKSIQSKSYNDLIKVDDYNIKVTKLTNNLNNNISKTLSKNYSKISVKNLEKDEVFSIDKQANMNYFLFSDSLIGLSVSYSENLESYTIGNINDIFYYGLEKNNSFDKKTIYIKSKNEKSKLVYMEFDNNEIPYFDFYVAKIEKNNKITYTLYIETLSSIIEAYSY